MGNNASSLPNNIRRRSISRHHNQEQTNKSNSQSSSIEKDTKGNLQISSPQIPINTENGYPPPYKPKAIVSPNIFIDHMGDYDYFGKMNHQYNNNGDGGDGGNADGGGNADDFITTRKSSSGTDGDLELSQVISGGSFDDDDDDYDVDADDGLINNKDNSTNKIGGFNHEDSGKLSSGDASHQLVNVLIKYINYDDIRNYQNSNHLPKFDDRQIYIIGSFNNWSKKIKLYRDFDGIYKIIISLPLGIYKVKFLVNNEIKYSEDLPIATDKSGNVVNWFEVDDGVIDSNDSNNEEVFEAGILEKHKINLNMKKSSVSFHHDQSSINKYSESQISLSEFNPINNNNRDLYYSQEIPEIFHQSDEILPIDEEFLRKNPIPELPIYLNNNYLNKHFNKHHYNSNLDTAQLNNFNNNKKKITSSGLNSHIIPHVNLNHLLTSNIKNNVLSVACTTRYSGKFITQIMYSPSE